MDNKSEELKIFAEAIKMGLRFTLALCAILCGVLGGALYYTLNSEQKVSIEAEQENNTNSIQEVVNGKTKD